MIKKPEQGVSMIELVLLVAVAIFLALLVGNLAPSISLISKSRYTSIAQDIAGKQVEALRKQTYDGLSLTAEPQPFLDPSLQNLPGSIAVYEVDECGDLCTLGEDIKKVKVTVSWNESGGSKKVELWTMVGEGGIGQ